MVFYAIPLFYLATRPELATNNKTKLISYGWGNCGYRFYVLACAIIHINSYIKPVIIAPGNSMGSSFAAIA